MSGEVSPQQRAMMEALAHPAAPLVLVNGFANTHSATEITSVVSFGSRPAVVLVMPLAVAKSFAASLLETVEHYEGATGTTVLTIAELTERITQYAAEHES